MKQAEELKGVKDSKIFEKDARSVGMTFLDISELTGKSPQILFTVSSVLFASFSLTSAWEERERHCICQVCPAYAEGAAIKRDIPQNCQMLC